MKRPVMLIAILPLLASGCESSTTLIYASLNSSVSSTKQGQECQTPDPVGLGRKLDLNGGEAMRLGGITRVSTIEYQVVKYLGVGKECVVAYGD
ncbi:MAG: hypothetical protein NDI90_00125 [Nitrospira sp. BO4]|jgi:hypothetical protein|nr:hypothetical protein [Nitrospira sp. BO4]